MWGLKKAFAPYPGDVTPLAYASARLSASPVVGGQAYLAAYEAGVYRTDDGGQTWKTAITFVSEWDFAALDVIQDPWEAIGSDQSWPSLTAD